jgi:lipopolysaccharide transport system permease protein
MTFLESMSRSLVAIAGNPGLVKQIVFPVETLPVRSALSSWVLQIVGTVVLLAYIASRPGGLPWTAGLLPVLFFMQLVAMVGISMFLASAGVFFRDMRELVQLFATAGLFLTPILYTPDRLEGFWHGLGWVLLFNPFSHLVWCYQDLLYFGRFEHPASWAVLAAFALLSAAVGYRFFRKVKVMFGDAL